jgi:RNA polymerase sigma-70 factor (ECF subfamily)
MMQMMTPVSAFVPPMTRDDSDDALAVRASGGDASAFEQLVERHYDFVHAVAWKWTGNRADAEDVAQMVCMRLGQSIRQWRGQGKLTSWLYRLTVNAVTDLHRSKAREQRKTAAYVHYADALGGEAAIAGDDEEADAMLWDAVRSLPDQQRDAVLLVHAQGLSHGEAALIMNCAEGTVSYHIHAARKRLKILLRDAGGDDNG